MPVGKQFYSSLPFPKQKMGNGKRGMPPVLSRGKVLVKAKDLLERSYDRGENE
jgi:hypothetical protein